MKNNEPVYELTVKDLQNIANEVIGRNLTDQEIKQVEENLGNFIDWTGAISGTISYLNIE